MAGRVLKTDANAILDLQIRLEAIMVRIHMPSTVKWSMQLHWLLLDVEDTMQTCWHEHPRKRRVILKLGRLRESTNGWCSWKEIRMSRMLSIDWDFFID